jgi:hypothetical protein
LLFEIDDQPAFELPLAGVTRCDVNETEAVIEFEPNEDDPVQLTEVRFHIPKDPDYDGDQDDAMAVSLRCFCFNFFTQRRMILFL